MEQDKQAILMAFKPFLWSYDLDKLDLEKNKKRIITNVLNWGTKEATDLLFQVYGRDDIAAAVRDPLPGEWGDKSLNYWSIIFGLEPIKAKDALRNIG